MASTSSAAAGTDPQEPSPWAAQILARHSITDSIDAGPMKTPFGAGELVLTSQKMFLVDFKTSRMVEATWDQMHKQSAIEDGLVQLMIDVEGYGLLELTITQRLGQSVAAQARTQSQGEESADERWVWQRAPLFVGQDPPTDLTNEPDQDAAAEIDLTESVMGDPLPVIDLREPAKRSPLAMVALGVVGLLVGFGVVSQLSSDSTPDDDQAVEVAGITTTPGVVTTVPGSCHENYGSCVPIAEDVDCEGGLGDGPAFVKGPIDLVGEDVYLLDTDKDGIACGSTDRPEDEVFDGN